MLEDEEKKIRSNITGFGFIARTVEEKAIARSDINAIRTIILGYERLLQDLVVRPSQRQPDELAIDIESRVVKRERSDV
jgi:hypothetical protein